MVKYLLFETASGYALFEISQSEEIGLQIEQVQQSIEDLTKFGKMLKLKSFFPFSSAENALENINDVSEGVLNQTLSNFLQTQLPKVKEGSQSKYILGVGEEKLASVIQENLRITCQKGPVILELLRGIRLHFQKFIKEFKEGDLEKAQLGLGHSYSRARVKFNVHRVDNMIIQSISLLDQIDKDVNTFAMRCREWYSWHFPELAKIVGSDATKYAKLIKLIKNKETLTEESLPQLEEITEDSGKAREILDAARSSMGTDISEVDMINIQLFADRVIELTEYREHLHAYLNEKMHSVAPNLSSLIGEQVGARLIAHAGSLTNLAKYPASTVQILGAEKALFRALKTKGNTPKYGLIFHSSFIGRANPKNKGRISRYLANKCTIAARIDSFAESETTKFGEKLKEQVEDRLKFYETGQIPKKNIDAMKEAIEEATKEGFTVESKKPTEGTKKKKKKKKKIEEIQAKEEPNEQMEIEEQPPSEEKKKKKKKKATEESVESPEKKKKKKKKE